MQDVMNKEVAKHQQQQQKNQKNVDQKVEESSEMKRQVRIIIVISPGKNQGMQEHRVLMDIVSPGTGTPSPWPHD